MVPARYAIPRATESKTVIQYCLAFFSSVSCKVEHSVESKAELHARTYFESGPS